MSAVLLTPAIREELNALYDAPGRPAHSLTHRDSLLAHLAEYRALFHDADAIEAAIWFHDAVHDAKAMDNEAKSAELCAARLAQYPDRARVKRILDMIMATAAHAVPRFASKKHVKDAELFLDIDLSVLGAPPNEYHEYEDAVREEYSWVDEKTWVMGRGAVLKGFIDRAHVFNTKVMRDRYEKQAQENLQMSIKKLFRPKPNEHVTV